MVPSLRVHLLHERLGLVSGPALAFHRNLVHRSVHVFRHVLRVAAHVYDTPSFDFRPRLPHVCHLVRLGVGGRREEGGGAEWDAVRQKSGVSKNHKRILHRTP